MSYCASRNFCVENVHTRNKQQTDSEIKRTQRRQCVKQTFRGGRRVCVWVDQKKNQLPLTQSAEPSPIK